MNKSATLLSLLVLLSMGGLSACSSVPVLPEDIKVKASREPADEDCKEMGPVKGSTLTSQGSSQEALEDMKKDAALKGANYVVVGSYSAAGTSVSGVAYQCP